MINKPKKIVVITSGQPSINPRLVKEADALIRSGYKVTVIYAYWNKWATAFDDELLKKMEWKAIRVGGDPDREPLNYFFSKLIQSFCKLFFNAGITSVARFALARSTKQLIAAAKKHNADLYIAHNLGALPAAAAAARKFGKPFGFDAEDFHRYETTNDDRHPDTILKITVEDTYLPHVKQFTAASPQIAAAYQKLYPHLKPCVINNVFHKTNLQLKARPPKGPLTLFWFSQTVGPNRGIELVIKAMRLLARPVELHLLGECSNEYHLKLRLLVEESGLKESQLQIHKPVPADDIFGFAARYDIGMATETGSPLNRDWCLTNKIFTYIQSGLAIIASDTTAQATFLETYPQAGKIYLKNDASSLASRISNYLSDQELLNATRLANYQLGQTVLNWETESMKFIKLVDSTLDN